MSGLEFAIRGLEEDIYVTRYPVVNNVIIGLDLSEPIQTHFISAKIFDEDWRRRVCETQKG